MNKINEYKLNNLKGLFISEKLSMLDKGKLINELINTTDLRQSDIVKATGIDKSRISKLVKYVINYSVASAEIKKEVDTLENDKLKMWLLRLNSKEKISRVVEWKRTIGLDLTYKVIFTLLGECDIKKLQDELLKEYDKRREILNQIKSWVRNSNGK